MPRENHEEKRPGWGVTLLLYPLAKICEALHGWTELATPPFLSADMTVNNNTVLGDSHYRLTDLRGLIEKPPGLSLCTQQSRLQYTVTVCHSQADIQFRLFNRIIVRQHCNQDGLVGRT